MPPPPPPPPPAVTADGLLVPPLDGDPRRSVAIATGGPFWRKLAAFTGPGYLVAVGYMDPGNWATDLAGGSRFGYQLLFVILMSNLMAMVLQALSARLGIVTGLDLAQACRTRYNRPTRIALWLLCELAIIACDLAEVLGTAVAIQLLFGIPIPIGVCLTAINLFLVLLLERRGVRKLEAFIVALMLVVALCLGVELVLAQPDIAAVGAGFLPSLAPLSDPAMLYVAMGIIGATVMPHNLYLHSSIVQTRRYARDDAGKREAIRFATFDSATALTLAMMVNAAILILAAATFHRAGRTDVVEIGQAYQLLAPALGTGAASILFGIALLASGQNSTVTGTLAGQVVMEGFTNLRLPPWLRRAIARMLAIIPAATVAALYGEAGAGKLLVLSQVVLSLQLPFAIVPLVRLTSDRRLMGDFASGPLFKLAAWSAGALVIGLNIKLLSDFVL